MARRKVDWNVAPLDTEGIEFEGKTPQEVTDALNEEEGLVKKRLKELGLMALFGVITSPRKQIKRIMNELFALRNELIKKKHWDSLLHSKQEPYQQHIFILPQYITRKFRYQDKARQQYEGNDNF